MGEQAEHKETKAWSDRESRKLAPKDAKCTPQISRANLLEVPRRTLHNVGE